jgi:hypothetical protein
MPDCRNPVEIPLSEFGLEPIAISVRWDGSRRPILTGDDTKFTLLVRNKNPTQRLEGSVQIRILLTSAFPAQGAMPFSTLSFVAEGGRTAEVPMPDQWMFVEGKVSLLLLVCTLKGQTPKSVELPLASFTVFERSTYTSQNRSSWTNLLVAATAAASSVLAAVLGFVLLLR